MWPLLLSHCGAWRWPDWRWMENVWQIGINKMMFKENNLITLKSIFKVWFTTFPTNLILWSWQWIIRSSPLLTTQGRSWPWTPSSLSLSSGQPEWSLQFSLSSLKKLFLKIRKEKRWHLEKPEEHFVRNDWSLFNF